jgi:hypothetical protein
MYLHARYGLMGEDVLAVIGGPEAEQKLPPVELRRLAWGIVRRCETAHGHYAADYRFCILAADIAHKAAATIHAQSDERARLLDASGKWCKAGLDLNYFSRKLRLRKTGLLRQRGAKREAAQYWAEYTDWHFWYPENHYLLAKLHVGSGNFQKAVQAKKWWEILTVTKR